jgi:hypothetical protein
MNRLEVASSDSPEAQKMFRVAGAMLQFIQLVCEKEELQPAHAVTVCGIAMGSLLKARHRVESEHVSALEAQQSVHHALAASIRTVLGLLKSGGITVQLSPNDLIPIEPGRH